MFNVLTTEELIKLTPDELTEYLRKSNEELRERIEHNKKVIRQDIMSSGIDIIDALDILCKINATYHLCCLIGLNDTGIMKEREEMKKKGVRNG